MDSRIIPPRAAVTTIMPALGGPSSTTFHSSGEKAAFAVIRNSFLAVRNLHPRSIIPIGASGLCTARRSSSGAQWLSYALTAVGWILATAVIAGVTHVIRRD